MNIKKSIFKVFSIIVASMFVLSTNVATVSEKGKISVENSEIKEIEKSTEKNNSKIDPNIPYRLRSKEEKENVEKENLLLKGTESKLMGKAKKQYQEAKAKTLVGVIISVHYNYSESEFETELEKLLGNDIEFQKTKSMTYELELTKRQIDIVDSMQQVMSISSPEDELDYICGEISDGDYLSLNAATKMMGTKKAELILG